MRNISGNIFADEFFGSLSQTHRLLWIGLLINLADDQGRMMDNVALMRSLLFPYDDVTTRDIEKGLALFVAKHKIIRYGVGTNGSSKKLIQITNWWKYQHMQWAARSMYPAPVKWMDRIRAHEKGNIIVTENWEKEGGLVETTKRLPSGKVATTNKLSSPYNNNDVNNDVNDVVVVVIADAFKFYEESIGKRSIHIDKELTAMFKKSPANLGKAISITADHGKDTLVYLKGVFNNLQKGTVKPEPRGAKYQPAAKKLDAGKQVRL
jgi:hypothetical protein